MLGIVIPTLRKQMPLMSIKSNMKDENRVICPEGNYREPSVLWAALA